MDLCCGFRGWVDASICKWTLSRETYLRKGNWWNVEQRWVIRLSSTNCAVDVVMVGVCLLFLVPTIEVLDLPILNYELSISVFWSATPALHSLSVRIRDGCFFFFSFVITICEALVESCHLFVKVGVVCWLASFCNAALCEGDFIFDFLIFKDFY